MSVPFTINVLTSEFVSPLFIAVQELPLSIDKNTPPPEVPAKIFVPLIAIARTFEYDKPLFTAIQVLPLLVDKFLDDVANEYGQSSKQIEKEAMEYLQTLPWTGNVRELRNVVERLVIMCNDLITLEDVRIFATPVI